MIGADWIGFGLLVLGVAVLNLADQRRSRHAADIILAAACAAWAYHGATTGQTPLLILNCVLGLLCVYGACRRRKRRR